jgi:PAS domain S-box-containing protein
MNNVESFDLGQRPMVLIVDDVRVNQEVLVELLKPEYQIKVASNGLRALDVAQRYPCPDLILLDINMPEMDGYEVCRRLQENPVTCDIPIIFVTAAADQKSEICGLELGAVDYICKPFNPAIVLLRVRNQILLRQSMMKLHLASTVFENTMEGIMITDAQGNIINVNPAFSQITGYTLEEVQGKNPRIFKSNLHGSVFYENMWEEITRNGYWQGEIWDKRKTGELHVKFLNINTIFNKEGNVYCYLALFSDITSRKQYEEEIKRLSESELNKAKLEAEKANRAKSEFLASMSHELRTPMNAVLGFAQLLEFEDLTEEQRDCVKEILTAGHHLLDLINEVLDLSRIEADRLEIKLETIDLAALMQSCISLVQPLMAKNEITIHDNTSFCHFMVQADSLHLKQVLLNLISNAIKYNKVGGSITISCENISTQRIKVNVTDTGKGLSEAQISKLFQPFERLSAKNSSIEGTGIGLCISKKLIEAMNGSIGVKSTEGQGSCFWIEIPIALAVRCQ